MQTSRSCSFIRWKLSASDRPQSSKQRFTRASSQLGESGSSSSKLDGGPTLGHPHDVAMEAGRLAHNLVKRQCDIPMDLRG
eukprot:3632749-Lingulodinium_polyedra.AAC.1